MATVAITETVSCTSSTTFIPPWSLRQKHSPRQLTRNNFTIDLVGFLNANRDVYLHLLMRDVEGAEQDERAVMNCVLYRTTGRLGVVPP